MMLEKAHEQMNAARGARGLAALARPWPSFPSGSAPCLTCHQGVENQAGPFASRAFSHAPHLARATLECAACHRPHEERAPGLECSGCHTLAGGNPLPDRSACSNCHED